MIARRSRAAVPAGLAKQLRRTPLPEFVPPMLCTLVEEPFDHPDWIFEPKFDGLRILGRFDGKQLTLLSRNNQPQNFQFPEIAKALRSSLDRPALVDGEVVCFDDAGNSSFRALQQRFHLLDKAEIQERSRRFPSFVYLFDLLYLDGYDLTGLPLVKRKELLRKAVRWSDRVRWTPSEKEAGVRLLNDACRDEQEGIIGKHRESRYVQGRSDWWVKVKCIGRQEFVIGGFTEPQRSRVGLGALLVGYYDDRGGALRYAGKVGTGYTRETLLDLRRRLDRIEQRANPFASGEGPRDGGVHWVRPRLVAEIAFGEWTQNGLLRQPRFEGLRPDKKPTECRRERPKMNESNPAGPARNGLARSIPPHGDNSMALEEYRAKRDFHKTAEPPPHPGKSHWKPIFVIQEHHASRLHYDFRLEADGVLKSWAVPKEPSLDPSQKRLAVQVEDHPLEYAKFKGRIPEGQYGAGTVAIWDHGTYENLLEDKPQPLTVADGVAAGRLEFVLHGEKLHGRFALIRMQGRRHGNKKNWLLIKMKDEHARPDSTNRAAKAAKTGKRQPVPMHRLRNGRKTSRNNLEFTHTDKIFFPEAGITKGDVLDYYRRVGKRLLPYLRGRPVTLERLPDGIGPGKPHFWQKDTPNYYPDWIERIEFPSERGKAVHYALVEDMPALLYLVNQGALTLHVGFSRIQNPDRPDFVLFDLDPGTAAFTDVVTVARQLHDQLRREAHASYVKTSGKTGLHVLVPWEVDGDFGAARAWALAHAEKIVAALPDLATTERLKAKRHGRVYVDVMQNAFGHHAVPPYVLRAVPEATVSMPLSWREVTPKLDPKQFAMKAALRRLQRQERDPFAKLVAGFRRAGSVA
jgi:bifunctional non-homologous end joining protein LigD